VVEHSSSNQTLPIKHCQSNISPSAATKKDPGLSFLIDRVWSIISALSTAGAFLDPTAGAEGC